MAPKNGKLLVRESTMDAYTPNLKPSAGELAKAPAGYETIEPDDFARLQTRKLVKEGREWKAVVEDFFKTRKAMRLKPPHNEPVQLVIRRMSLPEIEELLG